MYVDKQLEFSDAQAVTATANSENVVDLGLAGEDIGAGQEMYVVIGLPVAMTDAGSDSTVEVKLVQDDNDALSSPSDVQTIGTFGAASAAGSRLFARVAPDAVTERYLGISYTVANGDLTTGSFDAFMTLDIDQFKAYASGFDITT